VAAKSAKRERENKKKRHAAAAAKIFNGEAPLPQSPATKTPDGTKRKKILLRS
jgi:hypothetical protein